MTSAWYDTFVEGLHALSVDVNALTDRRLAPTRLLNLPNEHWGELANFAKQQNARWSGSWAEEEEEGFIVNALLEKTGEYLLARTRVPKTAPSLSSHTAHFPAANRFERHMRDLYGIEFAGHPDTRRWTRHRAWSAETYPLRKHSPTVENNDVTTPADQNYTFISAQGSGVHEIPVGPIHAGIIEPGHFRFLAVGETILNLEERLGYVHKGIEKIAEGRDATGLARLAGRVSGDTTVGHTYAACLAMEKAAAVEIPPRAVTLRAIMAERERVANHLGDVGAIFNDIAFSFGFYQFSRLREHWLRASQQFFGHRLMMDCIVPGGISQDIDDIQRQAMQADIKVLRRELADLLKIYNDAPSVEDRLAGTGVLSHAEAVELGTLGYVARASGIDFDVRRDASHPPYDRIATPVVVHNTGDVAARVEVRLDEIETSCALLEHLLADLPSGPVCINWPTPPVGVEGLALIEGWRGETFAYVRFGADGRVTRYFPRDPSMLNWPALERLIHGNIVPDFPVCNKSVNGSYSGNDL